MKAVGAIIPQYSAGVSLLHCCGAVSPPPSPLRHRCSAQRRPLGCAPLQGRRAHGMYASPVARKQPGGGLCPQSAAQVAICNAFTPRCFYFEVLLQGARRCRPQLRSLLRSWRSCPPGRTSWSSGPHPRPVGLRTAGSHGYCCACLDCSAEASLWVQ